MVKSDKCAENVCIPNDYNKFEMPDDHVHVDIGMKIVEILEINDHEFSAAFYMYFFISWKDSRIINNAAPGKTLQIETSFLDYLWVPDVYIYNLKSFHNSRLLTDFAGGLKSDMDEKYE